MRTKNGPLRVVLIAGVVVTLAGCSTSRVTCRVTTAVVGGVVGGLAGGLTVAEATDASDSAAAGAGAGSAAAGAIVGLILSKWICPEDAPPPPPPPPPPPRPEPVSETISGDTHFAFDSAALTPAGEEVVDEVARDIRDWSGPVVVEGHTDSVGTDAYNMKLSERRANTVREELIEHGVAPSRITTIGYGETRPIASNDTAEGRAQNRRVVIIAEP